MAKPAGKQVAPRRRIVVALDAGPTARAALEAAAALAAAHEAELLALFIEDLDLFHVAGLPFAHAIDFPSAQRRSLDVAALERSLRALAEDTRRSVEAIAQRTPLQWSFRVVRGTLDEATLAAAAEAELVVEALEGCAQAALQLAELGRDSTRARLVRARTRAEVEALKRAIAERGARPRR